MTTPIHTPAIVLGTRPLGEADLLVVLLTPTGKWRTVARYARRSKRRFAGGLPGGAVGEARIARGRGELHRLDEFTGMHDLSNLGRDLTRFTYVAYACELVDALVPEPEPDPRRFVALAEAIEHTLTRPPAAAVLRRLELRLLDTLGLLPTLDRCCVCALPLDPEASDVPFDAGRGGVRCPTHGHGCGTSSRAMLVLADGLASLPDADAELEALTHAPTATRRSLRDLTVALIRPQLQRPLRSLEFFAELEPRGA